MIRVAAHPHRISGTVTKDEQRHDYEDQARCRNDEEPHGHPSNVITISIAPGRIGHRDSNGSSRARVSAPSLTTETRTKFSDTTMRASLDRGLRSAPP